MKLKRPIIFMDIEATGADPLRDRIVEIALIKMSPPVDYAPPAEHPDYHFLRGRGSVEERVYRFNPGIRIPAEVILVHGITNEAIAQEPSFKQLSASLLEFIGDSDFGGFGVARFDVPILVEEFRRCDIDFPIHTRGIVDSLAIFHQREKRDLTSAYRFYCQKQLQGAHGARADALASLEVLLAQLDHYEDLPREVEPLHLYCNKRDARYVDSQRKFMWRDGEAVMNFGKHRGVPLRRLVVEQRDYIQWMASEAKFSQDVVDLCWKALQGEFPKKDQEKSHVA